MIALNFTLGLLGFFGWVYVWALSRYQTGACWRIQFGVALLGLMWLSLIVADTVEKLQPEVGTILARAATLVALWCLKPLLEKR